MTKSKAHSLTNLIGALLIVVALVSAGGLVYIASEYSKISDTIVSVEAIISDVLVVINDETGRTNITVSILVNNPSSLDIDIRMVQYLVYTDWDPASVMEYDREIGGTQSARNGTVAKNTMTEVQYTHSIFPDTVYAERMDYSMGMGNTTWFVVSGFLSFEISEYPDVIQDIGIGFMSEVEVRYV